MNKMRIISNTQAATKEDLYKTLAYFQDALDVAQTLKVRLENMPVVVRAMLEDTGVNLDIGKDAVFIFLQSINYLDSLMDCFEKEQAL
jgi:hypothetical protein